MFENIVHNPCNGNFQSWSLECGEVTYCGKFSLDYLMIVSYTYYYKRYFHLSSVSSLQLFKLSKNFTHQVHTNIALPSRKEIIKHKLSHSRLPDFENTVNSKIEYLNLIVNESYYSLYTMDIEAYVYPEVDFCSKI